MKVLYAVQATGNGHISRAKEIIPYIRTNIEVDVLLSGTSSEIELGFPIRFRLKGLSFEFGKNGGINIFKSIFKLNFWQFFKDVKRLPLKEYDFVINDFEPVSAWACLIKKKHCIALSHQYSLLNNKVPKPIKNSKLSNLILRYYAPSSIGYGFHFKPYTSNIYLPIIKKEFKNIFSPIKKNFFVVYLPAFDDNKIIGVLSKIHKTNWVVFSKYTKKKYKVDNIKIRPVSNKSFNRKLMNCRGVLCGAGFETPSEALFLKKKLLVVPMKNQYEQQCNAIALKEIGVPVIYDFNKTNIKKIKDWISSKKIVRVDISESPRKVINQLFIDYIKIKTKEKILCNYN